MNDKIKDLSKTTIFNGVFLHYSVRCGRLRLNRTNPQATTRHHDPPAGEEDICFELALRLFATDCHGLRPRNDVSEWTMSLPFLLCKPKITDASSRAERSDL